MIGQVIPGSFLWFVCLCAVLSIGIIGCGGDDSEDDNDWVGTWAVETIDGQSLEQVANEDFGEEADVSIVANSWRFNSDGTFEAKIAVKFEAKQEGLELSGEGSIKTTGTYSLSDSNYTITTTALETTGYYSILVGSDGTAYEEVEEEETGTWSRKGNTLTQTSDDGTTTVFKKK